MRDLHVIGVSDDGSHLLLAAQPDAARPTHRVAADDRLRTALRGDLPPAGRAPTESALTPKEIQARLRAGDTPEQVARVAGVPVIRVLRYAGPVLSERQLMVDAAQAAVMTRPRRGQSSLDLGQSVQTRLASMAGLRPDTLAWSARRRDEGGWVVSLSFTARGRGKTAQWLWDPQHRSVSPLDPTAAQLGYVGADEETKSAPRRRAPRPAPAKSTRRRTPTRKATTRTSTSRTTATKAASTTRRTKKPSRSVPAKKATSRKATAKRTSARRAAPAKRVPAARGRKSTAAKRVTAAKRTASLPPPSRATSRGGGRAAVPSWSDVLLGVQPTKSRIRRSNG